jgi:YVTN family beta-propeller protein
VTNFLLALLLAISPEFHAKQADRGTAVELSVRNTSDAAAPPREGEPALFTLGLQDETTGAKLRGVYPNVWMLRHAPIEGMDPNKRCSASVAALLTGGLTNPSALDLNIYYVLALNGDGSITVVDPRFGYGGTQLLSMLQLEHPGYDWTLAAGNDRLFVTIPESNRVAVVDSLHWKRLDDLDVGPDPRHVLAAPDGRTLWVTNARGVVAISALEAKVLATIPTGKGEHELAFSADGRQLLVTNRADGTASLIDVRRNEVVGSVPAGKEPLSIDVSPLSNMAYVASAEGTITVIDPKRRKAIATAKAKPGVTQIRVAPGGRYAFLANPAADFVQILDTASNRIIQSGNIDGGPFDIAFTETLAYVRRLRSETVQMIPLAAIGKEGAQVAVVDFPAGEQPFGKVARSTAAAGIVSAPGENAVIIANPADKQVYYYKEGMAAPIGHFSNYGHGAQAVLVLDRSIREGKDAYSATGILPAAGEYDVAVFINAPRVVSCFTLSVAENPKLAAKKLGAPVMIEPLLDTRVIPVRSTTRLTFRLNDAMTKQPREGLSDAMVLIVRAGDSWFHRQALAPAPGGVYATDFVPPAEGVYYVYVGCPSIGLKTSNPQYLTLEAR